MDLFKDQDQSTRAVPSVSAQEEARSSRRRRTERFAGLIDEKDMLPPEDAVQEESIPQATQVTPAVQEEMGDTRKNQPVAETRAQRRFKELQEKGESADFQSVLESILERDRLDESRAVGPLKPAPDAIFVHTDDLNVEQVVEKIKSLMKTK